MKMIENFGKNSCLVCAGKKIHYDFSLKKYRVEECTECGLMRLNPQPSNEELAKIYNANYFMGSEEDTEQSHVVKLKSGTADHYLDLLESYTKTPLSGDLLEIGCGQGDFLARAVARGLTVTGIEYSAHAANIAEKKVGAKGKIICGEISTLAHSLQQFDYIVFADVLAYVRDPRAFLKQAHALLKERGIMIAVVPSLDSFSARIMHNKWPEFKPEHLWYFSTNTLKRLLYSEAFGKIKSAPAKKTLSFDYIAKHFERYPVPPFSSIFRVLQKILPQFLQHFPFRMVTSSIVMFAQKGKIASQKKLSVIMAVFNEENTIQKTIECVLAKKIPNLEIELIIVESNSTDNTRNILQQYVGHNQIKIIWQKEAKGKGNAIREGLTHISGDFVLIQDADDEYDFEDYDVLLEPLMNGEAAFVLGARHGGRAWKMRQFSGQPFISHFFNLGHWSFTLLVNLLFKLRLKDPFTMFKVFRVDCLEGLAFECDRFDFDYELLIKLVKNGYKPIEIPVNYRSRSFKEGKKVRVIKDPLTWLRIIIKLKLQKA